MITRDRTDLAKRALRSFAEQTWPDKELVVVTDGEPGFVRTLLDEADALGIDVNGVSAAPSAPLGALRNLSLDAATGDLVCQWDDDDYSHPDRLTTQAERLIGEEADACFFTEHLQYIEQMKTAYWLDWTGSGNKSGIGSWFAGTLMMKRALSVRYPPMSKRGEDTALMVDLGTKARVVALGGHEHLYLYQYHGRNTFSAEHHHAIVVWSVDVEMTRSHEARLRDTLARASVPSGVTVRGREGLAFSL